MAEDQKKLDLTIGVTVQGGDNAVQRIAKLTREISNLEKNSEKLAGFASSLSKAVDAGKGAESAAKGLKSQAAEARALAPAIKEIKASLKDMPKDVLGAVGLDKKTISAGAKNLEGFQRLTEKLTDARNQMAQGAGRAEGLAKDATATRAALVTEAKAVTRLKNKIAQDAVASDKATSSQRVRATMANAQAEISAVKSATGRAAKIAPATAVAQSVAAPIRRYAAAGGASSANQQVAEQSRTAPAATKALKDLAQAGQQVDGSQRRAAKGVSSLVNQLQKEMRAAPKAGAALHTMLRRLEAANNPRYASGFRGMGQALGSVSTQAGGAARGFTAAASAGDSFLGQVKQVAVLATSFSILQGVAGKLQEGFHHLTGGIIGFNQVLERTEVGFNRLFLNQEQQVQASQAFGDTGQEVEYLGLGYESAGAAAEGMVNTIREFANVTPFRFEELAQSTLRMRAFGFSLDEVLYKSESAESGFGGAVVAIGDAVSALGGGALEFQRITYALGQMKQAGRVYQNDMMQLANAGIGGYKYIADALRREITKDGSGQRDQVKKGQEKLYDDLRDNAIETVRRLTTSGRISGESAARAIILGLETDFGGGMKDFSKTFVGAWTTLADTSQSLVATAFTPFYEELVKRLYEVGQFFQTDAASNIAKGFQAIVKKITDQLFMFSHTAQTIFGKIINDISGAVKGVSGSMGSLGFVGGDVFRILRDGIGVVSGLLQNDLTRGIILATVALKAMTAFAKQNPMLVAIMLTVAALGVLKQAYDQNFGGFATAVDRVVLSLTPVISSIRDQLLPTLLDIGSAVGAVTLSAFIEAFKVLAVVLDVVYRGLDLLLQVLRPLSGVIGVVIGAFFVRFAFNTVIKGFLGIAGSVRKATEDMVKMTAAADRLSRIKSTGRMGGFMGTTSGKLGAAGGAAMTGGMIASMAGQEDLGGALFTGGLIVQLGNSLKEAFPDGVLTNIGKNLRTAGGSIVSVMGMVTTAMVNGASGLATILPKLWLALGPLGPMILTIAGVLGAIVVASELVKAGGAAPKEGSVEKRYLTGTYGQDDTSTTSYPLSSGAYGMDKLKQESRVPIIKKEIAAIAAAKKYEEARHKAIMAHVASERSEVIAASKEKAALAAQQAEAAAAQAKAMKLLINEQNKEAAAAERKAAAQAKYNHLLGIAQQKLQGSTALLEDLAKGAFKDLLEPDEARINPYTGMAEAALEVKDVLEIEQDMLFTNFKNAQGITKSFDEFADILNSIVPLQEKDRTEGKLNLIAVKERLKIEKERRKELELIVRAAENEYDLGLATLQQYDESIDPLQRAVQLRSAQRKYEDEINKTRMDGLDLLVQEAEDSDVYAEAQKAMDARLEDIAEGQEYILKEMEQRFELFNQRVSNIMSNPYIDSEERTKRLKENQDALVADLEANFGITEGLLQEQFDKINNQIALARNASDESFTGFMQALTNPVIPEMTWGQTLGITLGNVFGQIVSQMEGYYADIVRLIGLINGAVASGNTSTNTTTDPGGKQEDPKGGTPPPGGGKKDTTTTTTTPAPGQPPRDAVGAFTKDGVVTINGFEIPVSDGDTMSEAIIQAQALQRLKEKQAAAAAAAAAAAGKIGGVDKPGLGGSSTPQPAFKPGGVTTTLQKPTAPLPPKPPAVKPGSVVNRASGGMIGSGLTVVGERGPELILPQSSGLVLNNSISSRLMAMLSGAGAAGSGGNVTINVNNPVIRNDADIRKLATEISKVQASQFRTQGGRL